MQARNRLFFLCRKAIMVKIPQFFRGDTRQRDGAAAAEGAKTRGVL